jgi:nicotinamide-nucleotide amidase
MWTHAVLPWLRGRIHGPTLQERCWTIVGVGESRVEHLIEEELLKIAAFEIGYCARPGEVDFRIVASGQNIALLDQAEALVRKTFGDAIATENHETLEACVVRLATGKRLQITTAESCTGGLVAHRLTNIPGSSAVFGYGWVTYANEAKISQLGATAPLFAQDGPGAVSRDTAVAMAEGARQQSGADLAVATTGIAGPDGGTPDKPIGTVWIALSTADGTTAEQHLFAHDRETVKAMASQAALDMLRRQLQKH